MAFKLPRLIGHRGAAAIAPENTLESFAIAHHAGLSWIECDAKLTKDGTVILLHDDTLDRTTNGHGNVADTNFDDIEALEAGSWFSDHFAGIKIPTLEETLDFCIDRNIGLNIEIKPCPGRDIDTAEAVLDLVSRVVDAPDQVLISSFSLGALETAQEMAAHYKRGLLLESDYPENWADIASHLLVDTVNIDGRSAQAEEIRHFVGYGVPVLAYTINDLARAKLLYSLGVTGVFSDVPDLLTEDDD
jgi:glycerophosphoryl diester phosphodiesterase